MCRHRWEEEVYLSLQPQCKKGVVGYHHGSEALCPRKTWYPMYMVLGRPWGLV